MSNIPQVTRLIQLIEENCVKKGYSEKKTKKIVSLAKNTLKIGVPKIEDLEDLLSDIGGLE